MISVPWKRKRGKLHVATMRLNGYAIMDHIEIKKGRF